MVKDLPIMQMWEYRHEIENIKDWDVMENFYKYICKTKNIWFATNIKVVDCINALKNLAFLMIAILCTIRPATNAWSE